MNSDDDDRQKTDSTHGTPDGETVWTTRSKNTAKTYHTDPENCTHTPGEDQIRQRDRATLDAWGWSECTYCAGERETHDNTQSLRSRVFDEDDAIQALTSDGDGQNPHRELEAKAEGSDD